MSRDNTFIGYLPELDKIFDSLVFENISNMNINESIIIYSLNGKEVYRTRVGKKAIVLCLDSMI